MRLRLAKILHAALSLSVATVLASCGSRTGLLEATTGDAGLEGATSADAADAGACSDPAGTPIYVLGTPAPGPTRPTSLLRFDPRTAAFSQVTTIACPRSEGVPFSLAVSRRGVAYVGFTAPDGSTTGIFEVDLQTGACATTEYVPTHGGPYLATMAFGSNGTASSEDLFADFFAPPELANDFEFGRIDATTLQVTSITPFGGAPSGSGVRVLTGTADGRLFAFSPACGGHPAILQIDPATATIVAQDTLGSIMAATGAVAFWGGDLYVFSTPTYYDFRAFVHTYDLATKTLTYVGRGPSTDAIQAAGVSTCAPLL
jgi:hypothetical protein